MIQIKVTNYIDRFISKCLLYKVSINIIYKDNDYIIADIYDKDLNLIKKLNYYSKVEIVKYYGFKNIRYKALKYWYDLLILFLFCLSTFLISNIILSINVNTNDLELSNKIKLLLKNKNIDIFTINKKEKELNKISEEIIKENNDYIEWLSIVHNGMHYDIYIEERIKSKIEDKKDNCSVVAKKDGIITNIISDNGVILVDKGELVHKGDILISSKVMLNDKFKGFTCANGSVYAETWYTIKVLAPLSEEYKVYTGNYKYNFYYGSYFKLFNNNYDKYDIDTIFKYDKFKYVKEKEYVNKKVKKSMNERKKDLLEEVSKSLLRGKDANTTVLSQKVLKERQKNSTIELEIFMSLKENIGDVLYEFEYNDASSS